MIKAHALAFASLIAAVFAGRESGLYPQTGSSAGTITSMLSAILMFLAVTYAYKAGLTEWEEG